MNIKFTAMLIKPVWDKFYFVSWHIIMLEVTTKNWVPKGMHMVSTKTQIGCYNKVMIDCINRPKAWQENLPHTSTPPPPAWTTDTRQVEFMDSSKKEIKIYHTRLCFHPQMCGSLDFFFFFIGSVWVSSRDCCE